MLVFHEDENEKHVGHEYDEEFFLVLALQQPVDGDGAQDGDERRDEDDGPKVSRPGRSNRQFSDLKNTVLKIGHGQRSENGPMGLFFIKNNLTRVDQEKDDGQSAVDG